MIHLFHGFLGSPEEFLFLQGKDVVSHDLYLMDTLPAVSEKDILIGYSMGGRVALEAASRVQFNIKKLILINSHPGLQSEEEREQRKGFESKVMNLLSTLSKEEFLKEWNSYPIFKEDAPIKNLSNERYRGSKDLFEKNLLSKQKNYLPELIQNKDKVLYILGLKDEKYVDMAQELLISHDIEVKGIEGGHRLLQHQEDLKEILISEGII